MELPVSTYGLQRTFVQNAILAVTDSLSSAAKSLHDL